MEELESRYIAWFNRCIEHIDLADAMRIDGHEGMATAYYRTAEKALVMMHLVEMNMRLYSDHVACHNGRTDILRNGKKLNVL